MLCINFLPIRFKHFVFRLASSASFYFVQFFKFLFNMEKFFRRKNCNLSFQVCLLYNPADFFKAFKCILFYNLSCYSRNLIGTVMFLIICFMTVRNMCLYTFLQCSRLIFVVKVDLSSFPSKLIEANTFFIVCMY